MSYSNAETDLLFIGVNLIGFFCALWGFSVSKNTSITSIFYSFDTFDYIYKTSEANNSAYSLI